MTVTRADFYAALFVVLLAVVGQEMKANDSNWIGAMIAVGVGAAIMTAMAYGISMGLSHFI